MKKSLTILTLLVATPPLFAMEVYKNGDNSVNVYGSIRGVMGFVQRNNLDPKSPTNTFFTMQPNSRIGTNVNYENAFATLELGLDAVKGAVKVRHLFGGYHFGDAGYFLVGHTGTVNDAGWNDDIAFGNNGAFGFGSISGVRLFQLTYYVKGFAASLVKNDFDKNNDLFSSTINLTPKAFNISIPRVILSYEYLGDAFQTKVGGTYGTATYTEGAGGTPTQVNVYKFDFAAQYNYGPGYVLGLLGYGANGEVIGEQATPTFEGVYGIGGDRFLAKELPRKNGRGGFLDVYRATVLLETGYNVAENVKAILGAGYQHSWTEESWNPKNNKMYTKSYAAYLQFKYKANPYLTVIPQVGYYGLDGLDYNNTSTDASKDGGTLKVYEHAITAALQIRVDF